MTKYRNKLVYDANTGEIRDDRKHMSMLEDYWFHEEKVEEEQKFQLYLADKILRYRRHTIFSEKTYKALNVPISRLESEANYTIVEQQKYREMK